MLKTAGYIEISYSTSFDGRVMILLLGNQRSLLTGYKQWRNSINDTLGSLDHWKMLSEDLEPKGGILSRRRILRGNGEGSWWCRKELCYGKAETLEDAEEAARGWRHNLVR